MATDPAKIGLDAFFTPCFSYGHSFHFLSEISAYHFTFQALEKKLNILIFFPNSVHDISWVWGWGMLPLDHHGL